MHQCVNWVRLRIVPQFSDRSIILRASNSKLYVVDTKNPERSFSLTNPFRNKASWTVAISKFKVRDCVFFLRDAEN